MKTRSQNKAYAKLLNIKFKAGLQSTIRSLVNFLNMHYHGASKSTVKPLYLA